MKQSTLNRVWARLILISLYKAGVRDICIAPGSRSTPLTIEASLLCYPNDPIRLHTHFDERGLGFLALGLAKATRKGVAVIVTSGTAVANLLPAVAESFLTREQLILLSADRPIEALQCGANQAIHQRQLFGSHVDFYCDLPSPSLDISPSWLLCMLDEKLHLQANQGGSLHINCPYPEPLYGDMDDTSDYLAPVASWLCHQAPYVNFVEPQTSLSFLSKPWDDVLHGKGVLIAGKITREERAALEQLANQLNWPLLCDPQSGKHSIYGGFDAWLQNKASQEQLAQAKYIVQFGARLVSKRLVQFISDFQGDYWLIDPFRGRLDPSHHSSQRIFAKPLDAITSLLCFSAQHSPSQEVRAWAMRLSQISQRYFAFVHQYAKSIDTLNEITIACQFGDWLLPQSTLFIGNSLAIRLLDICSQLPDCDVFANRGASGIDGLIASACGVQRAFQKPMVCLLGDTSALYDLNSLALLKNNPNPLVILIINNDGGAIFDLLPVTSSCKEAFYQMPHGFDFSHAAAMFGLNYLAPKTLLAAKQACLEGQSKSGTTLIELSVPSSGAGEHLQTLFHHIAHDL